MELQILMLGRQATLRDACPWGIAGSALGIPCMVFLVMEMLVLLLDSVATLRAACLRGMLLARPFRWWSMVELLGRT